MSGPTVPDADVDSAASFLGYLYIVSQHTVSLMIPCVWRILCLRNSSSVPYFRQPPNLPTAARRNRKCTECGTTAFGRNGMSAESANLSTFGAETEAEIRSTSIHVAVGTHLYSHRRYIRHSCDGRGQSVELDKTTTTKKKKKKTANSFIVADVNRFSIAI